MKRLRKSFSDSPLHCGIGQVGGSEIHPLSRARLWATCKSLSNTASRAQTQRPVEWSPSSDTGGRVSLARHTWEAALRSRDPTRARWEGMAAPEPSWAAFARALTAAQPHPGDCPNPGQRECGQLRGIIRESPGGRPGNLRDGDRGSVPRTDAGISEGRSRRASSGPPEAWRLGSHRSSPQSDLRLPQENLGSIPPAYLTLPPAKGKGTPPPPTLRCDRLPWPLAQAQTRRRGLTSG